MVATPVAAAVPIRIVKTIPMSSPTKPPAPGGNTKAPGGGVAKAPGGGVAKNSGGGVGMKTPGGGVGPTLKENDPPPENTGPAQAAATSWKRCSALKTKGSSTTNAHPASTPTSNPASVGWGATAPTRAVLNPAAAAIARKMTSAPRLSRGTMNPTRQRLAGAVDHAPPAALPPLPPGPADAEIVGLIERRVNVGRRSRRAQIVAKLAHPERCRYLGSLLGALLKSRPEKCGIAAPVGRDQGALVDVCAVDEVRRFELDDRRVHVEQQDALDEEQVIRVDPADRLDRLFEHRKEIELLED